MKLSSDVLILELNRGQVIEYEYYCLLYYRSWALLITSGKPSHTLLYENDMKVSIASRCKL